MGEQLDSGLDFDTWAELARTDPDTFERMRRAAIEDCIASAPEEHRQRLRCLQWRIDQERRRAGTPLAACIRISRMMWQSLLGENGLRQRLLELGGLLGDQDAVPAPRARAAVLAFARDSARR